MTRQVVRTPEDYAFALGTFFGQDGAPAHASATLHFYDASDPPQLVATRSASVDLAQIAGGVQNLIDGAIAQAAGNADSILRSPARPSPEGPRG